MQPVQLFCYECGCVQTVVKIVCLTHDIQSVIVSGAVIYPMLMVFYNTHAYTAMYNTCVIFLAVENNYLQGQICLSPILRLSSRNRFQLRYKCCHRSDFMATYVN